MGFILLLTVALIVIEYVLTGSFLSEKTLSFFLANIWLGVIAVGTVVATRIKGPDLSMLMMMAIAGVIIVMNMGTVSGIVFAILVCLSIGLINGAIISLLNAPAIIVTFITAAIIRSVSLILTDGAVLPLSHHIYISSQYLNENAFIISIVIAILALVITRRLLKPKAARKQGVLPKLMDIIGYGFVAVIAGIAGVLYLNRFGLANPYISNSGEFGIFIIIIFAAVLSSRLLRNGLIAMAYGVVTAALLICLRYVIMLLGESIEWLNAILWAGIIDAVIALILLCVACAAQGGWRSMLTANLSKCSETDPAEPASPEPEIIETEPDSSEPAPPEPKIIETEPDPAEPTPPETVIIETEPDSSESAPPEPEITETEPEPTEPDPSNTDSYDH